MATPVPNHSRSRRRKTKNSLLLTPSYGNGGRRRKTGRVQLPIGRSPSNQIIIYLSPRTPRQLEKANESRIPSDDQ